jgi:putative inorganic carbon (HCO3(-)) transporter
MLSKVFLPILGVSSGIFILSAINSSPKWVVLVLLACAGLILWAMFLVKNDIFLTVIIIDTGLLIQTHIFDNPDVIASRDGLQISITTISLGILYILWWAEIITKRAKRIEFFTKVTVIAFAYLLSCLLSIYNSQNVLISTFDIFFIIQMIMIYFYIANYIESTRDIVHIFYILLVCLFIQSAIIFIQYITQTQFTLTGKTSSVEVFGYFHGGRSMDTYRPAGTSGSPNETGGHIAILLLVVLSLLLYAKNYFKNILVWIVLLIGIAALSLTFSRGSWVAFTVGLVVFLVVALRHRWVTGKNVVVAAVLIAMILGVFSVPIAARLSQDDQGSALSRVPLMKLAFNMIQEHPIIGVGANNFSTALPRYLSSELRGEWLHIVHNQYLIVFTETGAIGLFFFISIIAIVIHICLRCIRRKDPIISPLSTGVVSGIIALSVFMTVELSVSRLTVQLFWIMASIATASEKLLGINSRQFMNLPTPVKVDSPIDERGFFAHRSG